MNSIELEDEWELQKANLKQKFVKLTGNNLLHNEGKRVDMLSKLQITLGKSKEELQMIIEKL